MTTTTIPGLEEAIDRIYEERVPNFGSPAGHLEHGIRNWWYDFQRATWDRWTCNEDDCPGRPAWDIALSEEDEAAVTAAEDEVLALIRERMTAFAETFQREHPEAVLRQPEGKAA